MTTETAVQRRFETEERVSLDLRIPAGRIEVEAVNDGLTTTTVELTPLDDGDDAARAIDEATVDVRSKHGGQRLVVDVSKRRFGRGVAVLLRVRCPAGVDLDARTASADVRTTGPLGSVEAHSASGEVDIDVVTGTFEATTASGDIEVSSVHGSAKVNTASGDVTIGRIGGDGKIRAASGDVDV